MVRDQCVAARFISHLITYSIPRFRKLAWWTWFRDYFPIAFHRTVPLDPGKNYIFGYHPHGILSLGAWINFATDATGFDTMFPGISIRVLTLRTNFRIPFFGLYLTALGICDASPESCHNILKKGPGSSLLLVLGGAREALDARPGQYNLTLRDRKGFVKIALQHGASLVPVFSFGETDIYDQLENSQGTRLRRIQDVLQKKLGFAMPLVKGRGIFQYRMGLMPQRRPIHSVVGSPIELPKVAKDAITQELVDKYHQIYVTELLDLFDKYKNKYASNRSSITIVQ